MSTSNGQEVQVKMESEEPTEDYQKLIEYGIDEQVAKELDAIYKEGKQLHLILLKMLISEK